MERIYVFNTKIYKKILFIISNKDTYNNKGTTKNKNENFFQAALRELEEETSIKSVQLIKEIDEFFTYELPDYLLGKIWKGKYRGQKQKWFIMRFVGNEEEINIKTKNAEFKEWKWIDVNQLINVVVSFKLDVYKSIVKELNILLN